MMNTTMLYLSEGRYVCPHCGGGRAKEKTFLVANGWGKCFRASCTAGNSRIRHGRATACNTTSEYSEDLLSAVFCRKQLGLTESEITTNRIQFSEKENRVVYPVYSYYRNMLGYVKRAYPWLGSSYGNKSLNVVIDKSTPFIHFPMSNSRGSGAIVIVEDALSAIKVGRYRQSCCLNGTSLTRTDIIYLLEIGIKKVYMCLDKDALSIGASYTRRLNNYFESACIFIDKDPKDMVDTELEKTFKQ